MKCRSQSRLGEAVILVSLSSNKVNRSPNNYRPDVSSKLMLSLFPQVPENSGDEIFERITPPENFRTVKVAATQGRFKRLNQPPFWLGRKIMLNALRSRPRLEFVDTVFLQLLKVKQRAIRFSQIFQICKFCEPNLICALGIGDRAVRRAEVNANRALLHSGSP